MKVYEDERIREWTLKQLRSRLEQEPRSGPFHASELFQCWRKTILLRNGGKRELTQTDLLNFIRGYAIQHYLFGEEEDGVEALGIILSPDHVEGDHIFEVKTTKMWYETLPKDENGKGIRGAEKVKFNPENMSDWIMRSRAYVAALGMKVAHIVVFFINQTDLHCWTIELTEVELEEAQQDLEHRRDTLQSYVDRGEVPPVTTRAYGRECSYCPFLEWCRPELEKAELEV